MIRSSSLTSAELHRDQWKLLNKLDQRADRQELQMARLFAGIAVVVFLGQILAPVITRFLGLPT